MKIIIVGSGRMGSGLALEMDRQGHDVTVIDSDPLAFERLGERFGGKTIRGVGFDREVLLSAGLDRCDGIAAVTSSDEANAVIARMAQVVFRVPKVVAGLIDTHKADIYKKLGVRVVSPIDWGTKRAADILSYEALRTVYTLGAGGAEIKVFEIPQLLNGHKVKEIYSMGEFRVISITRNNKTFLATDEMIFENGDRIHIIADVKAISRLRSLLNV